MVKTFFFIIFGMIIEPSGLISILLFMSILAGLHIDMINIDVLFLVIIMTSVIMIPGSFWRDERQQAIH